MFVLFFTFSYYILIFANVSFFSFGFCIQTLFSTLKFLFSGLSFLFSLQDVFFFSRCRLLALVRCRGACRHLGGAKNHRTAKQRATSGNVVALTTSTTAFKQCGNLTIVTQLCSVFQTTLSHNHSLRSVTYARWCCSTTGWPHVRKRCFVLTHCTISLKYSLHSNAKTVALLTDNFRTEFLSSHADVEMSDPGASAGGSSTSLSKNEYYSAPGSMFSVTIGTYVVRGSGSGK